MTWIDHIIYGTPDLEAGVVELERLYGVRAVAGGRHPGRGTRNALLALGPRAYLEILAPDPDQPPPPSGRPFGIEGLSTPRLVGWALATASIDDSIAAARAAGYDPGDAIEVSRRTPSGTLLRWKLTVNAMGGGPVPFLIDWGGADHPAATAPQGLVLEALDITHHDPDGLAAVLHALGADVPVTKAATTSLVARIRGAGGMHDLS